MSTSILLIWMLGFWIATDVFPNLLGWGSTYRNLVVWNYRVTANNICTIQCCMFWSVFGCCTLQTLVEICFFNIYLYKKLKKGRKSKKIDAKLKFYKNIFFKFALECWSKVFFSKKLWPEFRCKLKKFLAYSSFFSFLHNAYCDQCLECTAPKCRSKNTTFKCYRVLVQSTKWKTIFYFALCEADLEGIYNL